MAFSFGTTSVERLDTAEHDIQLVMYTVIKRTKIDFGIAEAHRTILRQQKLYKSGRDEPGPILTSIDGVNQKGKHNYFPSQAVDIYAWVNNKVSYEDRHLCYIAGVIDSVSQELYAAGKIKTLMRWGGNWDGDGEIITDQRLKDLPHFESYIP